jgi:integrase/recombinase XerC
MNINTNVIANKEQYIEKFLEYIDVSNNTIKEYAAGLKRFFNYCYENNIVEIQRQNIISFRDYLKESNKEASTINLYLASVKSFFKWLEYEGVYKDITRNVKSLPVEKGHKREAVTVEQLKTMLSFCESKRERLILLITITTGLRCNELRNIMVEDFKERNDAICLYVLGKARAGLKTDYVVIPDDLYKEIKDYIEENNITGYLFVSSSNNNKGNLMSTRAIRDIVNKIYEKAGLNKDLYVFHSLRHGFCNISLMNDIDIVEVSKAMRHKSIQTTMTYVRDIEAKDNKCFATVGGLVLS